MEYRYRVEYDDCPDLSYLDQVDEDGNKLFDINPDEVVSFIAFQEIKCPACGGWEQADAIGGLDTTEYDLMPGTFTLAELPDWVAEHFEEGE